jgi:glycine amidinotransferase
MARAGALRLPDELFDQSYRVPKPEETVRYLINEFEPAFDAADFRAAVATCSSPRSDVTNEARIAGCAVNPGDRACASAR